MSGSAATANASQLDVKTWLQRPGVKLLAVEFYATWCKPCMAAVPRWKALHEKYRDRGLRLVVVATRDPDGSCTNPGWNPDDIVCDDEGELADRFDARALPAAFLWSWQGRLLVQKGHVEDVEQAIDRWLIEMPRVEVQADQKELEVLIRDRLQDQDKLTVIATEAERKQLAELVRRSYEAGFDDKLQCEVGKDLSANSLLKATVAKQRLHLSLLSAERKCLVASSVVSFSKQRASRSIAEGVAELLAKLRVDPELPWARDRRAKTALAEVARAEKIAPLEPPPETMRELDVALLKILQAAMRTEKSAEKTDEEKAAAWEALANYSGKNPMKADAEKRRDHFRAQAIARKKRCDDARAAYERQKKDRAKLDELLALDDDVISREQKRAAERELETAYAPYKNIFANLRRECPLPKAAKQPPPQRPQVFAEQFRQISILSQELVVIERLLTTMPATSPERVKVLMRKADAGVELMRAEQAAKNDKGVTDARTMAIAALQKLIADYPKSDQAAEARFRLGALFELAGDKRNARATYYELIQNHPTSKRIPEAYLAFGELFYEEAQRDSSKWALAQAAYQETLKYPAPANRVFGYAAYKLARVFSRQGDCPQALNHYLKTIEHGEHADVAREEIIPEYISCGRADKAWDFFQRLAKDQPGRVEALEQLAEAYSDAGKNADAVTIYKDLAARDPERKCAHLANQLSSMRRQGSAEAVTLAEVERALEPCRDLKR
jgi:tetratricopeptide (TPR) repeat protein